MSLSVLSLIASALAFVLSAIAVRKVEDSIEGTRKLIRDCIEIAEAPTNTIIEKQRKDLANLEIDLNKTILEVANCSDAILLLNNQQKELAAKCETGRNNLANRLTEVYKLTRKFIESKSTKRK